jgi:hypothetical protein
MKTWWLALLAGAALAYADDTDKLAPYRDFVARWQKFNEQTRSVVWETTVEGKPEKKFWQEPTHGFEPPSPSNPKTNAPPTVRTESVSNTTVVVFDAPLAEQAFLPVGPKVKGDFAIEIVCRTVGGRTNDLSLLLDGMAE